VIKMLSSRTIISGFILIAFILFLSRFSFASTETIQYSYDDARQIRKVTYGDGTEVDYSYDGSGNRIAKTVTFAPIPTNNPPTAPVNLSPADVSTDLDLTVELQWSASTDPDAGDVIFYDVYMSEDLQPTLYRSGLDVTSYTAYLLKPLTTYYWQIIARDNHNAESNVSPVWSFTTGPDLDGDGTADTHDNCPDIYNPGQIDTDGDDVGDACDNCLNTPNTDQTDTDSDGIGNACDPCTDADGDGYAIEGGTCGGADCDDNDPLEHPGQTWFKDTDGDGYSDGTTNTTSCTRPVDYFTASELTATSGDCDDTDNTVYTGALEICDNKDNDCNGPVDDNCISFGKMSRNSHYLATEGWIVRAYTEGISPYSVYLEVLDTNNIIVPAGDIVGLAENPLLIASDAILPDISLAAYVIYTSVAGQMLSVVPDIRN
jgi:YD repeat-containing protein